VPVNELHKIYSAELSDKDFARLSDFIFREYGIKLPMHKKLMLQGRLRARLRERKFTSFDRYIDFLFSSEGQQIELIHMIDVVTTNKTDFFREPDHFDYLFNTVLSFYNKRPLPERKFSIWSAGCSTGEEPYTIAIILNEFKALNPGFNFTILATDLSSRALAHAQKAVYPENKVDVIPLSLKKNYLLKHKDKDKKEVRIVASLRNSIVFERQNLMQLSRYDKKGFDVIFCRNTLIYFDRPTQIKVVNELVNKLKPGGYLFIGHSESLLNEHWLPLERIAPTIYRKK
jgi:chemotaxis protein methyltransferase CheR